MEGTCRRFPGGSVSRGRHRSVCQDRVHVNRKTATGLSVIRAAHSKHVAALTLHDFATHVPQAKAPAVSPKTVHLIAAARPNFMKVAPLYHALGGRAGAARCIVHTGQHYDANMSDDFFRDLRLPRARSPPGSGQRQPRRADRTHHDGLRGGVPGGPAGGDRGSRGRQRHRGVRHGGGEAVDSGRAPGSGPAQPRPAHARGDQSPGHRCDRGPAVDPVQGCRREPAGRGRAGRQDRLYRQHHARLVRDAAREDHCRGYPRAAQAQRTLRGRHPAPPLERR